MAQSDFVCGQCGHEYCPECVVFPFGVKKPPMCIDCALRVGGVSKRPTGRPKLNRRRVKQRLKGGKDVEVAPEQAPVDLARRPPVETPPPPVDERWLEDPAPPDEFPGGWHQTY